MGGTATRLDAESLLFAQRQLTAIADMVYKREYPYMMANGEIIPVKILTEYAFKRTIEIKELDVFGLAAVISDYSKGGPRVGLVARRQSYPIKTVGDHAAWSWEELKTAQAEDVPLESDSLEAARDAFEAYVNKLGYFGDSDYGLPGLLTSNLPRLAAATTFAAAASPDALLALLNSPVSTVRTSTNSFETPRKIVMPQKQYQQLGTTMRSSNSDISVLAAFLDLQAKMSQVTEIIVDDNLRGAGTNGEDVMLLLPDDEKAIFLGIPLDFELQEPQQQNLEIVVHGLGRVVGAIVVRPLSGMIVEGI
jgi:hypothetical protein